MISLIIAKEGADKSTRIRYCIINGECCPKNIPEGVKIVRASNEISMIQEVPIAGDDAWSWRDVGLQYLLGFDLIILIAD